MNFSVIFVSFFVLVTLCASQELEKKRRPCNIAYRCSDVEEPVWTTTNNKSCEVFRNGCLLASTNCSRRNNDQKEAQDIGQEKCQMLCKTSCVDIKNNSNTPICGYYFEEKRNFGSQCEMNNFNCGNGKSFMLYSEGLCPV